MKRRGRTRAKPRPDPRDTEAALQAIGADELRGVVRDLLPWLDAATHARLANALVDRAARSCADWAPPTPSDAAVAEVEAFAASARRAGAAEPSEVDACLRLATNAFLARSYPAAVRMFGALLVPIGTADIDLGQAELVEEVLGVDVADCATQYVVAVYMTSPPRERAKAVLEAIDDMGCLDPFWEPLHAMERAAIEPLPGLDEFIPQWRQLVERRASRSRRSQWDSTEDRWLREVVARVDGSAGLADVARASGRADDLRAWCSALAEAGDWTGALAAYDEAAELVGDDEYSRGTFLDGAALAAQQVGRADLPDRLERAWRAAPSLVRLQRWLGTATSKSALLDLAGRALSGCPERAARQRAFLHHLQGNLPACAALLAAADGLGWSDPDHPGKLAFPLLLNVLSGRPLPDTPLTADEELELFLARDEPRLAISTLAALVALADVTAATGSASRRVCIAALRAAAEKRIAGVTGEKRRSHYGHAASLALACAAVDETARGREWLANIRYEYGRYPALQRELQGAAGGE